MAGGQPYLQTVMNSALNDQTQSNYWMSTQLAACFSSCVILVAKILATSLTIGSGGSGGVLLFPAVFLGGITGAAYAKFVRARCFERGWLPAWLALLRPQRARRHDSRRNGLRIRGGDQDPYRLPRHDQRNHGVCTGLVGPALMITCSSAYILSRSFTLNEEQVRGIADSPAHRARVSGRCARRHHRRQRDRSQRAKFDAIPANMPFDGTSWKIKGGTGNRFSNR